VQILFRRPSFGLVWSGGLISATGDWMLLTALPLYVYQLTGSTLATGGMLAAVVTPRLLLGSVAGVFVDRWDRRRTLVAVNVLLALGLLPLLLVASADWLWLVYLVAFAEAVLGQFLRPAAGALLPRLVGDEELPRANSLNALGQDVSRLLGPPLGGLIVGLASLGAVAVVDAVTFLVAALLTSLTTASAGVPTPSATSTPAGPRSAGGPWLTVWHEWLDGLRLVRRVRVLSVIFVCMAIASVGEGVMGTLFAPFTVSVLGGDSLSYGWLISAQGIGGILGSLILTWRANLASPSRLAAIGAIGLGVIDLLTFNYHVIIPGVTPGLVLMALAGFPVAALITGVTTLLQTSTDDAYRGRVLGAYGALGALSSLVGAGLGGVLGDRLGIVTMLNIQGVAYCVAGLIALALLPTQVHREEAVTKV
jgi:MFS family permease